jgi:hypothetical protein
MSNQLNTSVVNSLYSSDNVSLAVVDRTTSELYTMI